MASCDNTTASSSSLTVKGPTVVIVLGMAGSGKTAFVQRLTAYLHAKQTPPYVINLDPAVVTVPYPVNVDIRDTVKYKQVMKDYGLGPNGAILTSLNLMCTQFHQVVDLLAKRAAEVDFVLLDTPGQIEVFTWSASGMIIADSLSSVYATVIVYVVDSSRSTNPNTFMSNMLHACSILYRTKLPFVLVFNKADIVSPKFALKWITDFDAFQEALDETATTNYMSDLTRSLSLVLDKFYAHLDPIAVSAETGEGMPQVIEALNKARVQYKSPSEQLSTPVIVNDQLSTPVIVSDQLNAPVIVSEQLSTPVIVSDQLKKAPVIVNDQ